jgi:CHAD domain-containing protein
MSYRIESHELPLTALRRIAREQIGKAIEELDAPELGQEKTIHQVRKRCKKLRALMRLYRPADKQTYRTENRAFRDASRLLGTLRDYDALSETAEELKGDEAPAEVAQAVDEIQRVLMLRRNQAANGEHPAPERLDQFRDAMEEGLRRVEQWQIGVDDGRTLAAGTRRSYRRARKAMAQAYEDPSAENFHEWRKRVKYHWYHTRLLRDLWKPILKARRDELDELSDLLGDEHDLAVLAQTLCDDPELNESEAARTMLPRIEAQRGKLQTDARPLGKRLFAEKPKSLAARVGDYWTAWRA